MDCLSYTLLGGKTPPSPAHLGMVVFAYRIGKPKPDVINNQPCLVGSPELEH